MNIQSTTSFQKRTITLFIVFLFSLFINSCGLFGSDDDSNEAFTDGISQDIHDFVDQEILSTFEDSLQVPIHRGNNPPNIEDLLSNELNKLKVSVKGLLSIGTTFKLSPFIMTETIVPDDECHQDNGGCYFWDFYVRLSGQDMENFTINYDSRHIETPQATGYDGYIIGENNSFSIFAEQKQEREGKIVKTVNLLSGIVTPTGIEDPYYSFIVVENAGIEGLIPNGTGRTFVDGDSLAELAEWPETMEKTNADSTNTFLDLLKSYK